MNRRLLELYCSIGTAVERAEAILHLMEMHRSFPQRFDAAQREKTRGELSVVVERLAGARAHVRNLHDLYCT